MVLELEKGEGLSMMQLLADGNSPPPPIDANPSRGGAGLGGTRTCGGRGAEAMRDPSGSRRTFWGVPPPCSRR